MTDWLDAAQVKAKRAAAVAIRMSFANPDDVKERVFDQSVTCVSICNAIADLPRPGQLPSPEASITCGDQNISDAARLAGRIWSACRAALGRDDAQAS